MLGLTSLGLLERSSTISEAFGLFTGLKLQQFFSKILLKNRKNNKLQEFQDLSSNSHLLLDSLGHTESVARLDVVQYLVVGLTLEREGAKGDHLVEKNSVAPDV